MGQINLSRITNTASIITPPSGVDAIYNQNGVFYFLDSTGSTSSIVKTPIDGVGRQNYVALWSDEDTINVSDISYVGSNYYSPVWAGSWTSSIMVADPSGKMYNSGIVHKQIAVTVSGAEVNSLFTTPKVLVPRSGTSVVHQVISGYVTVNTPGAKTGNTNLVIYEGGNGVTHECNALGTANVRRYRFIPRNTSSSLVQTQDDDGDITLSTDTGNPTGGSTCSLTVYLTYTTYDETSF